MPARCKRAVALDEAGRHHLRVGQLAGGDLVDRLLQRAVVVGQVTRGGDARGQVQAAAVAPDMVVHVEQPGQHDPPGGVDFGVGRGRAHGAGRQHRADAAAEHVDIRRRAQPGGFAVEHPRVTHHRQPGQRLQPFGRALSQQRVGGGLLARLELRQHRIPAVLDQRVGAGPDQREEARRGRRGAIGGPQVAGLEALAGVHHQLQRLLPPTLADQQAVNHLLAQSAARHQGQAAASQGKVG